MKIYPDCGYFNEEKYNEYSPYPGECEDCYRCGICLEAKRKEEKYMITVSELKEACEKIEREFGSDTKVCIQLRNENGSLIDGAYCTSIFRDSEGNLFLSNHKFKHGSWE